MTDIAWEFRHSVEAEVELGFAWGYWTEVGNWDDPPARFELEGEFVEGARGVTVLPGQEVVRWRVREVRGPHGAVIEIGLEGATLSFEWGLERVGEGRTRLTQRVVLAGENAGAYLKQVRGTFPANLPAGMKRLAAAMEDAYSKRRGMGGDLAGAE